MFVEQPLALPGSANNGYEKQNFNLEIMLLEILHFMAKVSCCAAQKTKIGEKPSSRRSSR